MAQSLAISIPNISFDNSTPLASPLNRSRTPSLDAGMVQNKSNTFTDVPLTALNKNTRRQLSMLLNSKKILRSEEGYERDWRGIAALSRQRSYCDENTLSGDDAMNKVLQFWCRNNPETATFANLERFLGIIDRWDVSDDICENLTEDARNYRQKQQQKSLALNIEPDSIDSSCRTDDPNILTKDDIVCAEKGLPLQKYDAFVLYADADIRYAVEIINKLEDSPDYNFKLCLKNRDLLPGVCFEHVALTQLIEERCKRLIVILTEEFLKSPEDKFLVYYTQALQIQYETRKIIPLIYEDTVQIPRTLKIYTHLKYSTKSSSLYNFWDRLASSIRNVKISISETPSIAQKQTQSNLAPTTRSTEAQNDHLANLPTPPTEIPSININGNVFIPPEDDHDDDKATRKERLKFMKRPSLRNSSSTSKISPKNGVFMRNAHSTSQLNAGYSDANASISDLSTVSGCSEMKKKKKGLNKLINKVKIKVFSRSSTNLPETA